MTLFAALHESGCTTRKRLAARMDSANRGEAAVPSMLRCGRVLTQFGHRNVGLDCGSYRGETGRGNLWLARQFVILSENSRGLPLVWQGQVMPWILIKSFLSFALRGRHARCR